MQGLQQNTQQNQGCWRRFYNKIKSYFEQNRSQQNRNQLDQMESLNEKSNQQQLERPLLEEETQQNAQYQGALYCDSQDRKESSFLQIIICPFCEQEMQEAVYMIHIELCQQQIGNYGLIEQECQQCNKKIIKLYYNDHLDICEANCWIQVQCPYCLIAVYKVDFKEHISKCPTILDQQKKEKEGIANCTICLEDINENKTLLNCSHVFHESCIKDWLKQNKKCPVCKRQQPIQL